MFGEAVVWARDIFAQCFRGPHEQEQRDIFSMQVYRKRVVTHCRKRFITSNLLPCLYHVAFVMPSIKSLPAWAAFWIKEPVVLTIIALNTVAIFIDAFPSIPDLAHGVLYWVDYGCVIFFVVEALLKIYRLGFARYWRDAWNKLDFLVTLGGLPILLDPVMRINEELFGVILLGRFVRFVRLMRFIPNGREIWRGLTRALRASVGVSLVLFVLNLMFAMGANMLFSSYAPEFFGDPIQAFYSMFKVFTVEGWYEIPDLVARRGGGEASLLLIRGYFVLAVIVGGILGLSLANAIFVDEMTADNNLKLERMVGQLQRDLRQQQEQQRQLLQELRAEIAALREQR